MGNLDANWEVDDMARLLHGAQRARVIRSTVEGSASPHAPAPQDVAIREAPRHACSDGRRRLGASGRLRFEAGAAVSLLFAASYPERVTALVLHAPLVY